MNKHLKIAVAFGLLAWLGRSAAAEDVFSDVGETNGYHLVYDLKMGGNTGSTFSYASNGVNYATDNSSTIADGS